MAKWGEGDPRWIVEERADATNVNNWHWSEKNATPWSKDKIKSLLEKLEVENADYSCKITEVTKIEGEASANNRKAKLIFFYEWVITADWEGRSQEDDAVTKGKIEIPNLSEEYDIDEVEVTVTVVKESSSSQKVKDFMRKTGAEKIREQLGQYLKELKIEYSQGLILPTKGTDNKSSPSAKVQNDAKTKINQPVVNSKSSSTVGVRINCKKITHREEFMCRSSDLYRALTEKQMVSAFTRSEAKIEAETGVPFRLFGGIVQGEFTNLVLNERIEMRWRFQHWPDAHFSEVKIEFNQKENTTELQLTQTGVPQDDYERTKEGWMRYYWQPIKQTFGFGASLY